MTTYTKPTETQHRSSSSLVSFDLVPQFKVFHWWICFGNLNQKYSSNRILRVCSYVAVAHCIWVSYILIKNFAATRIESCSDLYAIKWTDGADECCVALHLPTSAGRAKRKRIPKMFMWCVRKTFHLRMFVIVGKFLAPNKFYFHAAIFWFWSLQIAMLFIILIALWQSAAGGYQMTLLIPKSRNWRKRMEDSRAARNEKYKKYKKIECNRKSRRRSSNWKIARRLQIEPERMGRKIAPNRMRMMDEKSQFEPR